MNAIPFDTLPSVQRLRSKGIKPQEPEAFAEELRIATQIDVSHMITREEFGSFKSEFKHDLSLLETRLEAKIDSRINALDAKISETKSDIIKWHFGSFVAIIGLLTAILFKLH